MKQQDGTLLKRTPIEMQSWEINDKLDETRSRLKAEKAAARQAKHNKMYAKSSVNKDAVNDDDNLVTTSLPPTTDTDRTSKTKLPPSKVETKMETKTKTERKTETKTETMTEKELALERRTLELEQIIQQQRAELEAEKLKQANSNKTSAPAPQQKQQQQQQQQQRQQHQQQSLPKQHKPTTPPPKQQPHQPTSIVTDFNNLTLGESPLIKHRIIKKRRPPTSTFGKKGVDRFGNSVDETMQSFMSGGNGGGGGGGSRVINSKGGFGTPPPLSSIKRRKRKKQNIRSQQKSCFDDFPKNTASKKFFF